MAYRVGYSASSGKTLLTVAAATKGELARGLKEVMKAWGERLEFPKFLKKAGEFSTTVEVNV